MEKVQTPKGTSFLGRFMVMKGALRELWIIFGTKILSIVAYGLVNSTLVLWLSKDLGYGDVPAGFMVAVWSALMTLFTVMVGSLVDAIGIRLSLLIGFGICLGARLVMSFVTAPWFVIPAGLLPLALGEALMVPVMVAAIKRFATTAQRSMAFSMFYAMMNVGFAISGFIFDKVRTTLGEYGHLALPGADFSLSTYQTLILLGFLFTVPNLILVWIGIRDGIEMGEDGQVRIHKAESKYAGQPVMTAAFKSGMDALGEWKRIFTGLWHQPAFYRFLAFLTLVVFVRMIFYHFHYTFPKYGIRELGEGAPIGQLFGVLNPVLIVILVPLVGALTQKISAYRVVIFGSLIGALSIFFMAMPPVWFQGLADGFLGDLIARKWLGVQTDVVNPLFVSIFFSVVMLSVGEAFFSPRLYEYPAAIAPKGQEASYMSLSMLPYFVAKFFVGPLSGWLLVTFCPESGPRNSEMMWLIIALMAMVTPIGLFVLRPWIQVQEAGRDGHEEEVPVAEAAVAEESEDQ
jgi:MFS family permease